MLTKEDFDLSDNSDLLGFNIFLPGVNSELFKCYLKSIDCLDSRIGSLKINTPNSPDSNVINNLASQRDSLKKDLDYFFNDIAYLAV